MKLAVWPLKGSGTLLRHHCYITLTTAQLVISARNGCLNCTSHGQSLLRSPFTVELGDKELFDKEQIGVKEQFPAANSQFAS